MTPTSNFPLFFHSHRVRSSILSALFLSLGMCGAARLELNYDLTGDSVPGGATIPLGSAGGGQAFTPGDAAGAAPQETLDLVEFSMFRGTGGTGNSQHSPTTYLVIYDGDPDTATQVGVSSNFVATSITDFGGTRYTWNFDDLTLDADTEYWAVLSNNPVDDNILQPGGTWLQMSLQTTNDAYPNGVSIIANRNKHNLGVIDLRFVAVFEGEALPRPQIGHYWDFDTLDPATSLPRDLSGSLVTTESGDVDLRTVFSYGEPFQGAGVALVSDSTNNQNYLIAETHTGTTATALDFGTDNFAFSYWGYHDSGDANNRGPSIFDCTAGSGGSGVQLGTTQNGIFNLRINDDDSNSVISNSVSGFESLATPLDRWVHVVVNVDRSSNLLTIYFDGVAVPGGPIDISSLTGSIPCSQDLQIGIRDNSTQDGALDEFAIYPGILSASQINALASTNTTPLDLLANFQSTSSGAEIISTFYEQGTGEFTMVFTSVTGQTYQVYGGTSLEDISTWPELTSSNISGTGDNLSFSHTSGVTPFFYQVRVAPTTTESDE